MLRVIYDDPYLLAVEKPAGFHVHPPEDRTHRISKQWSVLSILRDQCGHPVFPVHRLDRPTSGVLLVGKTSKAASQLAALFREREVSKTYFACVRGWPPQTEFRVDRPLEGKKLGSGRKDAVTEAQVLSRLELPYSTHPSFKTTRISLLKLSPLTGRYHQIRRHLAGEGYPLIGDSMHGDTKFNRAFREQGGADGLLLKAYSLSFPHPISKVRLVLRSRWDGRWHRIFDQMGICPFIGSP